MKFKCNFILRSCTMRHVTQWYFERGMIIHLKTEHRPNKFSCAPIPTFQTEFFFNNVETIIVFEKFYNLFTFLKYISTYVSNIHSMEHDIFHCLVTRTASLNPIRRYKVPFLRNSLMAYWPTNFNQPAKSTSSALIWSTLPVFEFLKIIFCSVNFNRPRHWNNKNYYFCWFEQLVIVIQILLSKTVRSKT